MRALALLLSLAAPALAISPAQQAAKVRTERRQYDNALNALEARQEKVAAANEKLNGYKDSKEGGDEKGKFGGQPCKIDSCIAKQQKAVARQEKLAAAALENAKKQAQQYIDQENAYAAMTGHFLNPGGMDEAQSFLAGAPTLPTGGGETEGPGLQTPDKPCLDSRGIPCIGDGTTDFESPTGAVDPAKPVVDEASGAGPGGKGPPGTNVGDIATGHEGQDLSQYAARGAQTVGYGGGGSPAGAFTGGERVALAGGSYSMDPAALKAEIARGAAGNARGVIDAMLKANPKSYQANFLDAQARNASGDWEGAEAAARRAIALDPNNPDAYRELAVALLHQGKDAEALEAAERAAELDPEDADARMLMAFAFEGLGRKEEMLRAVERAAELDPGRFSSYLKLARMGKRLFDRRRSAKGWHGIPVPAPGSDPAMAPAAAPAAASGLTADSRRRVMVLGGALVLLAVLMAAAAAYKKREDAKTFKLRG